MKRALEVGYGKSGVDVGVANASWLKVTGNEVIGWGVPDKEVLEEDENVVVTVVFLLQAVDGDLVVVPDAIDGDGVGIGAL